MFDTLQEKAAIHPSNVLEYNRDRFDYMRQAMNINETTVFLSLGLRYDRKEHRFVVASCIPNWMTAREAVELLQAAIEELLNQTTTPQPGGNAFTT